MYHTGMLLCFSLTLGGVADVAGGDPPDSADVVKSKRDIRNNKWWAKRPLPDKAFEAIIREATAHAEGYVFVNNEGKFAYCKPLRVDPRQGLFKVHEAADKASPKVKALGRKRLVLVVAPRAQMRYARMTVIFRLEDALAGGDYEHLTPRKRPPAKGPAKRQGRK
jgi:hypothetical protein